MNVKTYAASDAVTCWEDIDFHLAETHVKKLHAQIAKAHKAGESKKVLSLQHKLIHSFYAKALSVKMVTTNKGKRTPGIDGILWITPEDKWQAVLSLNRRGYHPKPLKRSYIQKPNGQRRLLGIPTMRDRAMQTLYRLALEPVAEITGDYHSYGYRHGRSAREAIIRCADVLSKPPFPRWILKADIQSCFNNINHKWVMEHIPMDKVMLQKFLQSGYIDKSQRYHALRGIPQGSSISPVICNMVLDGLEQELQTRFFPETQFVRYADDFLVIGENKDTLEQSVIPLIKDFLKKRELELAPEKTFITHIADGFDFLGWHVYQRGKQLTIIPSRRNAASLLCKIHDVLIHDTQRLPDEICKRVKPTILGWLNYHRGIVLKYSLYEMEFDVVSMMYDLTGDRHLSELISLFFSSAQVGRRCTCT